MSDGDSDTMSVNEEDPLNAMKTTEPTKSFWQTAKDELPVEIRFGFAHLALFYVLINNIVSL